MGPFPRHTSGIVTYSGDIQQSNLPLPSSYGHLSEKEIYIAIRSMLISSAETTKIVPGGAFGGQERVDANLGGGECGRR